MAWTNSLWRRLGRADENRRSSIAPFRERLPSAASSSQYACVCLPSPAPSAEPSARARPAREKDASPPQAAPRAPTTSEDLLVRVTEVRLAVDVINGGRDVKALFIRAQCGARGGLATPTTIRAMVSRPKIILPLRHSDLLGGSWQFTRRGIEGNRRAVFINSRICCARVTVPPQTTEKKGWPVS